MGGWSRQKILSKAKAGKLNMTWQVTASKQTAFMYHEVPLLDAWDHPKPGNKKLLASIVSILTLPKFHLATFNPSVIIHLSGI